MKIDVYGRKKEDGTIEIYSPPRRLERDDLEANYILFYAGHFRLSGPWYTYGDYVTDAYEDAMREYTRTAWNK